MQITKNKKGYKSVYNSLNSEKYWVEWTDDKTNIWHFEYNHYSELPDKESKKIKSLLEDIGLVYVYDLPLKSNAVLDRKLLN